MKKLTVKKEPIPDFISEDEFMSVYPSNKMTIFETKKPSYMLKGEYSHVNYEFIVTKSEVSGFVVDGEKRFVDSMKLFLIPSNMSHGTRHLLSQVEFVTIQFEKEFFDEIIYSIYGSRAAKFRMDEVDVHEKLLGMINQYIEEYSAKNPGYLLVLEQLCISIAVFLCRQMVICDTKVSDDIQKIIDYMAKNIEKEFSLDDISDISNMSKFNMIRKFKESIGMTPYDYYLGLRILKALEYLNDEKYKIIDVSLLCGFKNHSHFSKVFKNATGLTPTEYRNKLLHMK